jgi:heptosyltransferase-1
VRALVVRLSAIGDIVHALPAAAALARQGWEVDWLAEPAGAALLEGHPFVSRLITAPPARRFDLARARAALSMLREQKPDVALDVQGLWKSAGWARLSGARRVIGHGRRWRREPLSALLAGETVELAGPPGHVIDENLALLRPLGIDAVGLREFGLPVRPRAAEAVEAGLGALGLREFAVLNAGGGWAQKLWWPEGYGAVARGLRERGLPALVTWGPGEEALAERVVASGAGAAARCFPTSLAELLELLRRARVMISADTGPLHLACALRTPVVGLYGQTDPARNGPFSPDDVVVQRKGPPDPGHRGRFLVSAAELATVSADEVLAAVDRRLAAGRGRAHAV